MVVVVTYIRWRKGVKLPRLKMSIVSSYSCGGYCSAIVAEVRQDDTGMIQVDFKIGLASLYFNGSLNAGPIGLGYNCHFGQGVDKTGGIRPSSSRTGGIRNSVQLKNWRGFHPFRQNKRLHIRVAAARRPSDELFKIGLR